MQPDQFKPGPPGKTVTQVFHGHLGTAVGFRLFQSSKVALVISSFWRAGESTDFFESE
jgi:hypothetical protein